MKDDSSVSSSKVSASAVVGGAQIDMAAAFRTAGENVVLKKQRDELAAALRGVMGLVQLIEHGDKKTHTLNHRYKDAEAALAKL